MKFAIIMLAIFACLLQVSGDNMPCNTTKESYFPKRYGTEFQKELFNMFGLTPPKYIKSNFKTNTAGTKFILDVYKFFKTHFYRSDNRVKRSIKEIDLSENDQRKIDESNVIVTLENVLKRSNSDDKRRKLGFVIPKLTEIKKLVSAELRVFQSRIKEDSIFIISVYGAARNNKNEKHSQLKKVGERLTSSDYTGWLSIDISFSFNSWLEYPKQVHNIYLTVSPYNEPEKEMLPSSIGLQTLESSENQPFVVAYMKGINRIRLPRSSFFTKSVPTFDELTQQQEPCGLRVLKVPFRDLYKDWVIAPDTFEASLCVGHCSWPLKLPVDATNHAIVQSLMNLKQAVRIPKPCCVPSKHMPMSVVVREDQNHILRNFEDMIAVNCGCQ